MKVGMTCGLRLFRQTDRLEWYFTGAAPKIPQACKIYLSAHDITLFCTKGQSFRRTRATSWIVNINGITCCAAPDEDGRPESRRRAASGAILRTHLTGAPNKTPRQQFALANPLRTSMPFKKCAKTLTVDGRRFATVFDGRESRRAVLLEWWRVRAR